MGNHTCSVEECDKPVQSRQLCQAHYWRLRRHGDVRGGGPARQSNEGKTCSADGCEQSARQRGMCMSHYHRWYEGRDHLGDEMPIGQPPVRRGAPASDRFWCYVIQSGACWLWVGNKRPNGYGRFWTGETYTGAHQWSYEHFVGPVPDGCELDHLCRVRHCVRPDHLEPVDHRTNVNRGAVTHTALRTKPTHEYGKGQRQKTHCPQGHEYSPGNTYVTPDNRRMCRMCTLDTKRRYRERQRRREVI